MNNNEVRALNYTQRIIQGDYFNVSYTMADVDNDTDVHTPIDISNKTIRGQVRMSHEDVESVNMITDTFDSGTGVIDTFRIQLLSSQTTNMQPGAWRYDVDMVDNTNNEIVETLLKGNFIVRAEISK